MQLPVQPPLAPMLAQLVRELPGEGFVYEPKWDGFRCLAFRDGDEVDLRSRHDRPLARYFPELVEAIRALPCRRIVLDGEIILAGPHGFDFAALMGRLHPAPSRVEMLSRQSPASYVAFDVLAAGDDDLRHLPFRQRRARLVELAGAAPPPVFVTPATTDLGAARAWFERFQGAGIDGLVAKAVSLPYLAGKRAMIKVKHERTADCVLAGVRLLTGLPAGVEAVSSLLLGLYDDSGELRHVGVVTQLPAALRVSLVSELEPLRIPLEEHPWRGGFAIERSPLGRLKGSAARWTPDMEHDWIPLRPERVCEVGFDQTDVDRFRHPARFRRWRPDREASSCQLSQIEVHEIDLAAVLKGSV